MNEVIKWLQSPAGEKWSHQHMNHISDDGGNPVRHSKGVFADLKYDHECQYNSQTKEYVSCYPARFPFSWTDSMIIEEISKYGMNGIPR